LLTGGYELRVIAIIALVLMVTPASSFAGKPLGLKEAINLALEKHNLVKAAVLEEKAAGRQTWASRGRLLPRISLDETASASNTPTRVFMMKLDQGRFTQNDFDIGNLNHPSSHADFRTSITLDQPLFDASIFTASDMADKEEKQRGFALQRRRQDVAFMVYRACVEVKKAKAFLEAADQGVADAREHERLARVRDEAGTGLRSDELRARTFLAEMEQQRVSAENSLAMSRLRLARIVGEEPGESADFVEELSPLPLNMSAEELRRLAWENRQDMKETALELEKAETGLKGAKAAYLPTLYGTAGYQMNDRDVPFGRDNDSWMVGASLRWELFDGFSRWNEKEKAKAMAGAASEYLEDFRKEVAIQVEEMRLKREEAMKRLEAASHAVRDSEETVRLISRRFENSISTMVELLDAQTALNSARARLIANESDYALATARLFHATGTFLKEVMK
jgi:outer membrane protein TolC